MKSSRLLLFLFPVLLFSCVSSKQHKLLQGRYNSLDSTNGRLKADLKGCEDKNAEAERQKSSKDAEIARLNDQITLLKENNTVVLNQLKDLSVITSSQAESIRNQWKYWC